MTGKARSAFLRPAKGARQFSLVRPGWSKLLVGVFLLVQGGEHNPGNGAVWALPLQRAYPDGEALCEPSLGLLERRGRFPQGVFGMWGNGKETWVMVPLPPSLLPSKQTKDWQCQSH